MNFIKKGCVTQIDFPSKVEAKSDLIANLALSNFKRKTKTI